MNAGVEIAVLMPHAPILVPAVAGEREDQVRRSVRAMREVTARVVRRAPESVVVVSPHSPRRRREFGVWVEERHHGSMAGFRAPEVSFDLPNDRDMLAALEQSAAGEGIGLWPIGEEVLDHGASVPLWFLWEAGWRGPTTVLSLNYPGNGGLGELGRAIANAARRTSRKVALIASGDMSHRLQPGAPGGFHPEAKRFDETFIRMVGEGRADRLLDFDPALQELAGEDALDSTRVALAAVDHDMSGCRVLDYQGPFGVGYGVAVLHDAGDAAAGNPLSLPRLARLSVEAALLGNAAVCPAPDSDFLRRAMPVFVTIHTTDGGLRGCVGSLAAHYDNVAAETWANARAAAFRDSRFPPVRAEELGGLVFEVSVLHSFEEADATEIDPRVHGVLVSTADGRRGVLLPDIEGIDTAERQIEIARRKGDIGEFEKVRLQRFTVDKFEEQGKLTR